MLAGHWRESVQVVGLVVGGTVCYYVWSVSAIQQAVVVHGMSQGTALQASLVSNLILIFTLPLWGACLIGSAVARSWRSAISPRLCCSCR